jgi:hypothetical protein
MSKRPYVITASAVCLLAVLGLSALFAAAPAANDWNAIKKSYAEANLELAQARLALAADEEKLPGGSVSDDAIGDLRVGVELAKEELAAISRGATTNPLAPQIAAAELTLRGLEAQRKRLQEANKLTAGAVSDLDLRLAAAQTAVAKAQLAALKALADQPAEVRMQWQIKQLQDEVRALWARPLIED